MKTFWRGCINSSQRTGVAAQSRCTSGLIGEDPSEPNNLMPVTQVAVRAPECNGNDYADGNRCDHIHAQPRKVI
jgi:hypothetical protein